MKLLGCVTFAFALLALTASHAEGRDELCDSSFTNCRVPLLSLIQAEMVEIDVGMWFMEDGRYSAEIIRRLQAGVRVRIIFDNRSDEVGHPINQQIVDQLAAAGVPMRLRVTPGSIEHWKVMVFHGQNTVYFGSANFSAEAFVPTQPYINYVDETVYFTDNPSVVNSFRTRFDDAWVDETNYSNYANVAPPLARSYDIFPIDPDLNFTPGQDFVARTMQNVDAEGTKIDVMMYRIVDDRALRSMVAAQQRGTPIRLLIDPQQYRDPTRQGVSFYLDKLFMAGIPMRSTVHEGPNHGKLTLLYGQTMSIFGSSNWTIPSANTQHEHNYFTRNPSLFNWFVEYFERRWSNTNPIGVAESAPFTPLPPDKPVYQTPANGAIGVAVANPKLKWIGGPWAQYYDIYFGTDPNPPLFAADRFLGPSITGGNQVQSFTLPTLRTGTTYYWKIVSKTAANLAKAGVVWSFTTAGTPPPPLPPGANTIVLWTSNVGAASIQGDWTRVADANASGGFALQNPDRGRGKIAPALAAPTSYFEANFNAVGGVAYRVWVRMRAQSNSTSNDSVHLQFSDSVDANGAAWAQIGTTSSLEPVLQEGPAGGTPQGYGWTDNGWDVPGAPMYFAASGGHTIRVQQREDGAVVDEIVLSPDSYFLSAPGQRQNDATILPANDGGEPPPPPPPPSSAGTIVLWARNIADADLHGSWQRTTDSSAAGGGGLRNPNLNQSKVAPALASPANYFETTFTANSGTAYHLWLRFKADENSVTNDSVHVQFNDSLNGSGVPTARIGTTGSAEVVLQAGSTGPAPHGWGWSDNGWDTPGAPIYFATTGTHTIRIQQREDGPSVDQIVLSPDAYFTNAPGARRDDATILNFTQGTPPPPPSTAGTIVLRPGTLTPSELTGRWEILADTNAAGGSAVWNRNLSEAKIAPALSNPASYFEMTFNADAGKPYHLWIRLRAEGDLAANDSVHLQFNDSIDAAGNAIAQIGTSSSAEMILQAGPTGALPSGWGWGDNGWGVPGANIYFAASGQHTLRIQQREDGPIIDQIVISPDAYLSASPGARRNDATILAVP